MDNAAERTAAYVAMHHRMGVVESRRRVPRARPPTLVESDYAAALVRIVHVWRDLVSAPRQDDLESSLRARSAIDRARITITASARSRVHMIAERAAVQTAKHHKAEFIRQMKAAFGVEVPVLDRGMQPLVERFILENTTLLEKLGQKTLDDIEKGLAAGQDVDIAERFAQAERHARFIARDQIGKLNAQVTRMRHQEIGVAAFRWITKGDSNVRPAHAVKHNRIFPYEGSRAPSFLPGDDYGCRCREEPVFDEIRESMRALVGKGRRRVA